MDNFKFERRVSLFTAVFIVIVVAFLVIRNAPVADANLVVLTRIILALAVGLLGATMPGFLNVTYNFAGFAVRATGATALFLIAYFGTSHVEALHLPDTLEKKNEISRHLSDPNNCQTALSESQDLIKIVPNDAVAHSLNGFAEYCVGNIPAALTAFEVATTLDPKYRPAKYNKAAALVRLGRYPEAEAVLALLIAADPNYTSARYNLAVAQAGLKKYDESFQNFDLVYEKDKQYDAAFGLGFLYLLKGTGPSEDKSLQHFKIALGTKPPLVCVLYKKLPYDHELQEEKPFIDIARVAEANATFLRVRANFDVKFRDAVCQDVG